MKDRYYWLTVLAEKMIFYHHYSFEKWHERFQKWDKKWKEKYGTEVEQMGWIFLFSLLLAIAFEDSGWMIAFSLLLVADAICEKRKVE